MKNSWFTRLFILGLCAAMLSPAIATPNVTPLTFGVTIERGDVDQARRWLDDGLPAEFVGDRVGTGLMIAAWEGNVPMMEVFYQHGARIDTVNKNGEQALQLAAFKGNLPAIQWLLDHGAQVNRAGNQWGALHYAVFNGHREVAQYLIQHGADVNARAPNQATSLMLAAREGKEAVAEDLIKAGADPSLTNDMGETALVWAMRHGNIDIAKLVSSPEAFANAVRNQSMMAQQPMRSIPAPQQIEDLLRRIRQSEAQNLPTAGLRKQLATVLLRQREENKRAYAEAQRKEAGVVKGVVVTGQSGGGEKVEVLYGGSAPAPKPAAPASTPSSVPSNPTPVAKPASAQPDNIQALMARIRTAKAKGQPTDDLRKQLMDAVSGYRGQ